MRLDLHTRVGPLLIMLVAVALAGCATTEKIREQVIPIGASPKPTIKIEGVSGEVEANVRAHLALTQESCSAPHWRVGSELGSADAEVKAALQAFGYYHPQIRKNLHFGESCWQADIHIDPGPRVHVSDVDVEVHGSASQDPAFKRLLAQLPISKGAPLNQGHYEQAKQEIQSLAAARGYFDGHFTRHELRVNVATNEAQVLLTYDSGPRYHLGRIEVHQQALSPNLVERFIGLHEGQAYTSSEIADTNRALVNSGYWSQVSVSPLFSEAKGGVIPLDINLVPRKKHSLSFGAGVSTDTGPRGTVTYENRRVNRAGHRLSVQLQGSLVNREFVADYRIPLSDPRTEWLSLQAGAQQQELGGTSTDTLKLGARRTQSLPSGWLKTTYVDFTRETSTIGSQRLTDTLVIPGITFARTKSDRDLYPRFGYHARGDLRGSETFLGSSTAFVRVHTSLKWIHTLPWGDRLLTRGELGAIAVGEIGSLPVSQRFFAGGDNSVRGYGYQDLGPKDAQGNVVGGQFLVVGSLEYEHMFLPHWGAAAFIDTGNAFDTPAAGLKTGVGVGLRWRSPIGPVRLDLAFPLESTQLFRIHFSMGPDL